MWFWWLLGVLLILVLVIGYMPIRMKLYLSRKAEDDELYLDVNTVFGLVHYRYRVPKIKFKGTHIDVKNELRDENQEGTKVTGADKSIDKENVESFITRLRKAIIHTKGIVGWAKDVLAKVRVCEFKWRTDIGVGDAPETAITSGLVWGLKANILGFALRYVQIEKRPVVQVNPVYNRMMLSTELQCHMELKMGQLFIAGFHLLRRILKEKGGLRGWRGVIFKT